MTLSCGADDAVWLIGVYCLVARRVGVRIQHACQEKADTAKTAIR